MLLKKMQKHLVFAYAGMKLKLTAHFTLPKGKISTLAKEVRLINNNLTSYLLNACCGDVLVTLLGFKETSKHVQFLTVYVLL